MENSIRERRTGRGWTQDDLAEKLDVSRQTIISLEKGRYNPSLVLAFKIAKLFDCRIEDIFTPEEE
ncbi:helix-turn-helix transcriptional regulator [Sporosarcina sp. NCCP-2716]|uniref:helix-turn-helix transcriptional regulator n=1 Tax=Sporosarcina sp. NCCP-2716 TaxID=2943679 RepID=UPI00203E734B|nr:helix-turn-helix transcriptional regulator [Sporosarcina sp. NCCP-2716]